METKLLMPDGEDTTALLKDIVRRSFHTLVDKITPDSDAVALAASVLSDLVQTGMELPTPLATLWQEKLAMVATARIASWIAIEEEKQENPKIAGLSLILGKDRDTGKEVWIDQSELSRGVAVWGGTGSGKTTFNLNLFLQALKPYEVDGEVKKAGGILVDVDGDAIKRLIPRIPEERVKDTVRVDCSDRERFVGLNPLTGLTKSMLMAIATKLWDIGPQTPRLVNTLNGSIFVLRENGLTISEMPYFLRNKEFRLKCLQNVPQSIDTDWLKWFWEEDFDQLFDRLKVERSDSTLNKIIQFLMQEEISYSVCQEKTTLPLRSMLDEGKIILVELSPHKLGEDVVRFLGHFLIAELKDALFSRADVDEANRPFFLCVCDEWQLYLTPDFKDILTRGRKYGAGTIVATQVLANLEKDLQEITQQLGNQVSFRVSPDDAKHLAPFFAKEPTDLLRRQEILTPATNPIDQIIRGHAHTDERVNRFVRNYVREEPEQSLTDLWVKAMRDKHTNGIEKSPEFKQFLWSLAGWRFYPPVELPYQVDEKSLQSSSVYFGGKWDRRQRQYAPLSELTGAWFSPPTLHDIQAMDEEVLSLMELIFSAPSSQEQDQAAKRLETLMLSRYDEHNQAFRALQAEKNLTYMSRYTYDLHSNAESSPYGIHDDDASKQRVKERVQEAVKAARQVLPDLKEVLDIIALEPIAEGSGIYENVVIGQRPVADMQNEMAAELVSLQDATAYVSLGSRGKQTKPLIATLPLPALPQETEETLLQTRLMQVAENTKPYTAAREDIERALLARKRTLGLAPGETKEEETPVEALPETHKEEIQQALLTTRRFVSVTETLSQHPIVFTEEKTAPESYLSLLYFLGHVTLQQAVTLTGKETSRNNERAKFNKLVKDGLVVSEPMKEAVTTGKVPLVYSLTAKGYKHLETEKLLPSLKRGEYDRHGYLVNEIVISAILAAKHTTGVTLVGLEHEKMFRMKPIALPGGKGLEPDGLITYQVGQDMRPIAFEVDTGIETNEQLLDKLQKYLQALRGPYQERFGVDAITVCLITPNGTPKDEARLKRIIEQALKTQKDASTLFLAGSVNLQDVTPETFLTTPVYSQPFDANKHAIIE